MRHDAISVHKIDYRTHGKDYEDKKPYHFLQFSAEEWKKEERIFYLNRLRHVDYRRIFLEAGFTILEEKPIIPTSDVFETLNHMIISEQFHGYTPEELSVLGGWWVLKKD
jgi:hypothetical protein